MTHDNTQSDVVEALPKAFRDQACAISKTGSTVTIECDDADYANDLLDWLASLSSKDSDAVLEERWQPRLGEKVRMTDACPDAEQWNRQEWFVAGIQRQRIADRYTAAFDIFVSATWPEITDPTDGFIVNHPTKPDELEPAAIRKGDNA